MMHYKFVSENVFKSEIIFSPIFQKRIPSWLSSSLNPLKSFRLDFIIVSKDLRKERGSDPELLFTSFRLDLIHFFSLFSLSYIKILYLESSYKFPPGRSLTVSPSTTLPTWDEKSWGNDKNKKNVNQMTFAKIKKLIYLAFQWIPEIIAHTLRLNLFRARSCNIGNDRFLKTCSKKENSRSTMCRQKRTLSEIAPFWHFYSAL